MSTSAILSGREYLSLPREKVPYLIEPLLPKGGSMMIYADAKVGKSFATFQMAEAVATGRPDWIGFPISKEGGNRLVIYIQLDTPRVLWTERLVKNAYTAGLNVEAVHQADRETLDTWPFDIFRPDHATLLRESLAKVAPPHWPDLVIIDTLKESNTAPENDNTEQQKAIAALENAVKPAALVLVHHAHKPNHERPDTTVSGMRGASYLAGRMDAILFMKRKEGSSIGTLSYTGRAVEEGVLKLERLDHGFWKLVDEPAVDEIVEQFLVEHPEDGTPIRELARVLHQRLPGKSEEACRKLIIRKRRKQACPTGVVSATPVPPTG